MSLADALNDVPVTREPRRNGPTPACDIYGPGNIDDFIALRDRRLNGEVWIAQQRVVDSYLGITARIKNDKFRYHWSGKCGHWDHVRDEIDAIVNGAAA